uniref:Uncharacterized protein n=1 Tax=Knipowitschia caucasica TaxID=637954 RepID=A0AAV2MSD2_KNICA
MQQNYSSAAFDLLRLQGTVPPPSSAPKYTPLFTHSSFISAAHVFLFGVGGTFGWVVVGGGGGGGGWW